MDKSYCSRCNSVTDTLLWNITSIEQLQGDPVSMKEIGVDQIDYSNFVSKTKTWNSNRVSALRTMLGEEYISKNDWMIYKVNGRILDNDSVTVHYVPFLLLQKIQQYLIQILSAHLIFNDYEYRKVNFK